MRTKTWLSGLLIFTCGCSGMSNTEKGLLGGAGAGTAIGAIAGRGHPGAMLLGAGVGTLVGGVAGAGQDAREDRKAAHANAVAIANAQSARQMSLNEVIQMAQTGQSDAVIIDQIRSTNSVFQLSTADVNELHQQRVSDNVIRYMQSRRYAPVHPRPVVVYERTYIPPPPPPPDVRFGVMIGH